MIKFFKFFLKQIIEIFIKIIIIIQGIIIILINIKKILNAKIIIFASGGFGHTILIPDLIRSMKNKDEYLYFLFFEFGRHNYYSKYLHQINQINLYVSLLLFGRRIGEYEKKNNLDFASNFIVILISKIINKKAKIFSSINFWKFLINKNKVQIDNFIKVFILKKHTLNIDNEALFHLRRTVLSYLFCKKNSNYKLPEFLNRKIINKIPQFKKFRNKFITIYFRNRPLSVFSAKNRYESEKRNINVLNYVHTARYFLKLGWKINLIGDNYLDLVTKLKNHKNLVYAEKYALNKRLFEIFSMPNSKFVITTNGGGQSLGFYNHMINVNSFPMDFLPMNKNLDKILNNKNDFILYKNFFFKKRKILSIKKFVEIAYKSKLSRNYEVYDNDNDQLLKFCKKNYKKYIK